MSISHTKQIKGNFHNCNEKKIQFRCSNMYITLNVMLCHVRTLSLADSQALHLLLMHTQNVN